MKYIHFLYCLLSVSSALAQTQSIKGVVTDKEKIPLVAVNIYLKNHPEMGTSSDEKGEFLLSWDTKMAKDSIVLSYTGYKNLIFAIAEVEVFDYLPLVLEEQELSLKTFAVVADRSIAEEFSVQQLERLDIYKNPIAAADPLRAITALAASTNTDESANPSLRGSNSTRTRVLLNGVPVYKPVRNSQINGLGNFSLFNTELIDEMTVYAGNPPLIYGNASAGVVELNTRSDLYRNSTQVALSLANVGVMSSYTLPKEGLLQVYGNHQVAAPFLALNAQSLDFLNDFGADDVGLHWKQKLGQYANVRLFSYAIDESYAARVNQLAFEADAVGEKRRNFNILNFNYQREKHFLSLNHGNNFSTSSYQFGNLQSEQRERQFYYSANYKYYFTETLSLQSGINYENNRIKMSEQSPIYYYALEKESPTFLRDTTLQIHDWQYYAYAKWKPNEKWILGAGWRGNLNKANFISYQGSARYQPNEQHSFLLAGGKYHNYNIPNYLNQNFDLLSSQQWSLEYAYKKEEWEVQWTFFQKAETGDVLNYERQSSNARQFLGIESLIRYQPSSNWNFSIANTWLDAKIKRGEGSFRAVNDLNYFIKASVQYDNLAIASFSLFYVQRPGTFFTPVVGSNWDPAAQASAPIFASNWNEAQFNTYRSLNFAASKVLLLGRHNFVLFFNVNNLLNQENEQFASYNEDYSVERRELLALRTIYFGGVWSFEH
ncbi:MAG: TonB-dependent receptor plug domain-containing protein [Bacteroidota bacterium]